MANTLYELLPRDERITADVLLDRFLEYVSARRLTLYPAQEEGILELFEDKNLILNTPTGSGKSLVASAMHFASLARGRRSVYTCPIKALVNEKWLALCREFGPEIMRLCKFEGKKAVILSVRHPHLIGRRAAKTLDWGKPSSPDTLRKYRSPRLFAEQSQEPVRNKCDYVRADRRAKLAQPWRRRR